MPSYLFPSAWSHLFGLPFQVGPADADLPLSPREERQLLWLVSSLPVEYRADARRCLRTTLRFRASGQGAASLDEEEPEQPEDMQRFGLLGEWLLDLATPDLCAKLRKEIRAILRTLEEAQPRLVRNRRLAMHSARLGQLVAELTQPWRDCAALAELRNALALTWG